MNVEDFIARWTAREGGAERANYQMFLTELCDVISVKRPDPAGSARVSNDYVFERAVLPRESEPIRNPRRIDLYKKNAFILEAKQSRLPGKKNAMPGQLSRVTEDSKEIGRRNVNRGWDALMQNARQQAEGYVFLLDADHPAPPFIVICDVGHCLELYADFTGTGRAYTQFPDRNGFRIFMEDLRKEDVRSLLAQIWTDPQALDPARRTAKVTRDIAERLAHVSKSLEEKDCDPEQVAHFLMRCLFTMFAEDVDLLPQESFKGLLLKSVQDPQHFPNRLGSLWQQMEKGEEFSHIIDARVRHFNGGLFKDTTVFSLKKEEIGELLAAAEHRWTDVDPAIFGTLLEQALNKEERKRLGAHYTPRSYVQRLVEIAVMEPLRLDWQASLTKAEQATEDGDEKQARSIVRNFHRQLCRTRVLDPACGTGNFLYVALESMKKLEGEVLETLAKLGEPESLGLERETVDPHQFLGLEVNPRAAAIAELVVWIGYLQQHYRTRTGHPSEPILRAFENINFGSRHGYDAVLKRHASQEAGVPIAPSEPPLPVSRPEWPDAEFIVGNPPFIAGQDMRAEFGNDYVEALWALNPLMNDSADFVMYWWDRAAEQLTRPKTSVRRFGFVTTNSISQVFQRRTIARWLTAKRPLSIIWAVDNHPWTKATPDAAAVRIAMTVADAGSAEGRLLEVVSETKLNTDTPEIKFIETRGRINSDLTIGADVTKMKKLLANEGLSHDGVKLHGKGFVVTAKQAELLGLGKRADLHKYIKDYANGRSLRSGTLRLVVDLYGLSEKAVREGYPEVYQHLLEKVRYDLGLNGEPRVDSKGRRTGREWNNRASYRDNWWIFGEPRSEMRPALEKLERYIGTVDTSPHRIFEFIDASILVDDGVVVVAMEAAEILAVLSSRIHVAFSLRAGGWLGVGDDPRWNKSLVFEPFPFPELSDPVRRDLAEAGEELDRARKKVISENPDLTLTDLYNVLEKIKNNIKLTHQEEDIKSRGSVRILGELHSKIDTLAAQAYGWPTDLTDSEIIERIVALNDERSAEERAGHVRWLRPSYQASIYAKGVVTETHELQFGDKAAVAEGSLPSFPTDRYEQPLAVETVLQASGRAMSAEELSRSFKRGGKRIEQRIVQVLATLTKYGRITSHDGLRFVSRRAA
ncbi:class I SAM-dependent DNA methyltransferase [Rhizobium sullae]|uniref:site-specific DNA-methyltransferase (adenine-specific) n=1 Tax=Rhizobium sullae TaxID=50338 RepID=A0A4R3Q585_RHISU|nr:DNA methyltransferase [Rhizobium sullae]TCU16383.1 type II restriction/modification system DNA methylase subunit YeeA [Rhizobium sullae]